VSLEPGPVGEFETVIPATLGELLAEVPSAARWARWSHSTRLSPEVGPPVRPRACKLQTRERNDMKKRLLTAVLSTGLLFSTAAPGMAATYYYTRRAPVRSRA